MDEPSTRARPIRIGIVGFGALGQYLYRTLLFDRRAEVPVPFEVAFVWNRTPEKITDAYFDVAPAAAAGTTALAERVRVPDDLVLRDMSDIAARRCDVIVEVCHPDVLAANVERWLAAARAVYVGSPTGFASDEVLGRSLAAARAGGRSLFVPAGALWGVADIAKMGARRSIAALHVTMRKPAASTRLLPPLQRIIDDFEKAEADAAGDAEKLAALPASVVVFDGPIGELCPLAPNNVNTMACAALASGTDVGFRGGRGTLVVERGSSVHVVEVEVTGKVQPGFTEPLRVKTSRVNPCAVGAVTGIATYASFFSSLITCVTALADEREGAAAASSGLRFC
jgi:aspartate dehydrogenase